MKTFTNEQLEYAVGRLARLVHSREITQTQLAQFSGVKQSTISKILSARQDEGADGYTPSGEILSKLFKAMGLKLSDVLNESDQIAEEILGYMATPLTGLSDAADAEVRRTVALVKSLAADDRFDAPKFDVYWPGDHTHPREHVDIPANQVYVTDRSRASTHDFIILFCGAPSYGVGQENEIATQAGVPAIRLLPRGMSRMMTGSFINAHDVYYSGMLDTGISFDADDFLNRLQEIRKLYFRHRAMFRGMNGDAFGGRLRKQIDDRYNGGYEQFAHEIGVGLSYLHTLMDEPFAVSNPSVRLLRRMAALLDERVAYLIGERDDADAMWIESNASWRQWIDDTPGLDARVALRMRDEWRHEYSTGRRERLSTASHRDSVRSMTKADWDKRYTDMKRAEDRRGANATIDLFK